MNPKDWVLGNGASVWESEYDSECASTDEADAALFNDEAWFVADFAGNFIELWALGDGDPVKLAPIPDDMDTFVTWARMVIDMGD